MWFWVGVVVLGLVLFPVSPVLTLVVIGLAAVGGRQQAETMPYETPQSSGCGGWLLWAVGWGLLTLLLVGVVGAGIGGG
jgi:hypothetical protein